MWPSKQNSVETQSSASPNYAKPNQNIAAPSVFHITFCQCLSQIRMFSLELKTNRIRYAIFQLRDQLYSTSLSDSPLSKYVSLKENTTVQI